MAVGTQHTGVYSLCVNKGHYVDYSCLCFIQKFLQAGHNCLFKILGGGGGGDHVVWACGAQIPRGGT